MFFVIRGNVLLTSPNGLNPRECLTGDVFAEICPLFPELFAERTIARTFCDLYVLTKAKFDDVMNQYYSGSEPAVLDQMAETLERYNTQQRKTQKILGNGG
ncbi:unnamed protein product [Phytophthora lilii]|uniref:Unnamed protein product n=1 Tax=Phytophthora lilii TaxID=2077276 RepID=A0A9W6UBS1_9STRA|nr:unnamed protein product [Phytophthora lilii]